MLRANTIVRTQKDRYPDFIDNSDAYIRYCRRLHSGENLYIRCFAPYSDIFIDAYENVYVCNYFLGMDQPIANLSGGSAKRLWKSDHYQAQRNALDSCNKCNYMCHRELSISLGGLWFGPISK